MDRDTLARYMFQRQEDVWRSLAGADVDDFDNYVERNQEEWRMEADRLLHFIQTGEAVE